MITVLVLTALFNIIQNTVSFFPAYAVWMRFRTA
jgi:hypothetical protein